MEVKKILKGFVRRDFFRNKEELSSFEGLKEEPRYMVPFHTEDNFFPIDNKKGPLIGFWKNSTYESEFLVETIAFSIFELVTVNGIVTGLDFILFNEFQENVVSKDFRNVNINFWSNVIQVFQQSAQNDLSNDDEIHLEIEYKDITDIALEYRKMLSADDDLDGLQFIKELKKIIEVLETFLKSRKYPNDIILFFMGLAYFYLGKYSKVKELYGPLLTRSHYETLTKPLIRFVQMILHDSTIDTSATIKRDIKIIASSLRYADGEDIVVIEFLDDVFNSKHGLNIEFPNFGDLATPQQLLDFLESNVSDDLIFMGHGSKTEGLQVILNGNPERMDIDHFEELINKGGVKEALMILSCNGEFYNEIVESIKNCQIGTNLKFLYCLRVFSWRRMELFCAGYFRGKKLGLSFERSFELGRNLLLLRNYDSSNVEWTDCKNPT